VYIKANDTCPPFYWYLVSTTDNRSGLPPPGTANGGVPPPRLPDVTPTRLAIVFNRPYPCTYLYNGDMTTLRSTVLSPGHIYPGHPEEPRRFTLLDRMPVSAIENLEAAPASLDEIALVHEPAMIEAVRLASQTGPAIIDYAPTYVTPTSFEDALLAAGATLALTRAVVHKEAENAFALVRPPGHHAEPERAMGFCLFNNVAIAARAALAEGLDRVMIVDFDAHHGNGTQAAFWHDERVAYFSSHQGNIYPGTGWIEETPHARGRIVNAPLPAYAGDAAMARLLETVIHPMAERFWPEMILVSAGYDAHWNDPLTTLGFTTDGYFAVSQALVGLAKEFCEGRIVFALEGGYDPHNVANGAAAAFAALTGQPSRPALVDGSGLGNGDANPHPEPDIEARIHKIRQFHGLE